MCTTNKYKYYLIKNQGCRPIRNSGYCSIKNSALKVVNMLKKMPADYAGGFLLLSGNFSVIMLKDFLL